MPSSLESFLWWPVLLQAGLFGFLSSLMLIRAAWIPARLKSLSGRLDQARDELFAYVTDPQGSRDPVLATLAMLPGSEQLALLGGLSRQLDGLERARLRGLAASLGLVQAAAAACHDRRWWERLHGVRTLLLLGAPTEIPVELVRDSHPLVRAEAVRRWSTTPLEGIPQLLALLDDPTPVGRFAVQDALLKMGSPAAKPLGDYLIRAHPVGLTAAIEVAARLADSSHLKPALDLSRHDLSEVRASAAQLLGALGGAESRDRLVDLLRDTEPSVRSAALASIARTGEWSLAPIVARSLGDDEWEVRRHAALTLAQFGSAGRLYLHKAAEEQSPAGTMARFAISLPDSAIETL